MKTFKIAIQANFICKNILIISIFLITFNVGNLFSQQGWYQVTSPGNESLSGIYFRDINNGIVREYKTSDGGQNWINTNGGYGYSLSFPNTNTGYAAGIYYFSKTTDFGSNWISMQVPDSIAFYGVAFPNTNTGFICGTSTKIFKTSNSGSNWSDLSPQYPNNFIFYGLSFIDTSLGFIVGHNYGIPDTSLILKTTNGGTYWGLSYLSYFGELQSIYFINSNTGFVAGDGGTLLKTTNSGVSWNYKPIPTSNIVYSIFFTNTNTAYGVCAYGDIIKTTDGGNTWYKQTSVTGNSLKSVFFINDLTGYACGDNGTVLKTTNGGGPPIGIKPIGNNEPKSYELFQNYPNPFNPVTKIKFALPKTSLTKLIVFDLLGQQVAKLVDEELTAGTYETEWNGSNFASGIYFYKLITGSYTETKKMVLVK